MKRFIMALTLLLLTTAVSAQIDTTSRIDMRLNIFRSKERVENPFWIEIFEFKRETGYDNQQVANIFNMYIFRDVRENYRCTSHDIWKWERNIEAPPADIEEYLRKLIRNGKKRN